MGELRLTPQQSAAVHDRDGALLISAAAGSGKTKVLIDRVLHRVAEDGCNVDDFLMITFTQAAAGELRGKLIAELSQRLARTPEDRHLQQQMSRVYLARISTVHGFCAEILRVYAYVLDLSADFRVCDEQESSVLRERALQQVLEEAYKGLDSASDLGVALNTLGAGRNDRELQTLVLSVYDSIQCYQNPKERIGQMRRCLCLEGIEDVGQTIWGQSLISRLHRWLDEAIGQMRRALERSEAVLPNYVPGCLQALELLTALRREDRWEKLRGMSTTFERLKQIRNCEVPEEKARVQKIRSWAQDGLRKRMRPFALSSREAMEDLEMTGAALRGLLDLVERFSLAYGELKLQRHLLDYNDLEQKTLGLLWAGTQRPTGTAREIGARFKEIMVDEYQDTNAAQDAIFRAISNDGRNLFQVGDVKQSIYRFRMADPTIFLEKYKTYADVREAVPGQPRRILLSDNFRSHPGILEAANDVFYHTMTEQVGGLYYTAAEALRANRPDTDLGSPEVELHCIDLSDLPKQPPVPREEVEAEFVARRIHTMLVNREQISDGETTRPVRPEDIVILMRSVSEKATVYLQALQRYGIPARYSNDDLFATQEIGWLVALLKLIDNPHDDIALLTALLSPLFCFCSEDLALCRAAHRSGDLYEALEYGEKGREFRSCLEKLRDLGAQVPLRTLLDEIDDTLHLRAICGALADGEARLKNLDRFCALADSYTSLGRFGLSGFLRYLAPVMEAGIHTDDLVAAGAVRLMTIHKSKGLEFPVVFLADLAKGFNQMDAAKPVLVDNVLGIGANVYDPVSRTSYPSVARQAIAARMREQTISEEMRVLYVAMTRPQCRLVMTYCNRELEEHLATLAENLTEPLRESVLEEVRCAGDWILLTALGRIESGTLVPALEIERRVASHRWRIETHKGGDYYGAREVPSTVKQVAEPVMPVPAFPAPYPHKAATLAAGKLTATQLKGRNLDDEVGEKTVARGGVQFVAPRFLEGRRPLTPAERGTAIHLAMQYLRYEFCTSLAGIREELDRLLRMRQLTAAQHAAVDPRKILRFFDSALGRRVLGAPKVVREFKFSILEDAGHYDPDLTGEQVLLQGVTDCCLIEPEGLTILDFKTDRVRPGEEPQRAAFYLGQLEAYSRALGRIFRLPVHQRVIYFFATDSGVFL